MKKIIIFITLLIFIPFFIVIIYNKNYKEIELNYINVRYIRVKRNQTNIIETIPLESYIVGVLAGEMPIDFDLEALKAQAVASRSYALKRMEYNKDKEYDVVDTILNQVYLDEEYLKNAWGNNYVKNINKLRKAVNETIDEYLEYNGSIVDAMFFSTSNGYTEDSELVFNFECDYLRSVDSPWDAEVSSAYLTTKTISLTEFYDKLNLSYDKNLNIEIIKRSNTNRILLLKINNQEFSGTDVYNKLSLRSTDFTIELYGDTIKLTTKGYGHGVGMSQYGALGMAKKGYTYEEILKHYYQNVSITKLKNLAVPAIYGLALFVFGASMYLIEKTINNSRFKEDSDMEYVDKEIVEDNEYIPVISQTNTIMKPYLSDTVSLSKSFYDYEAESASQENSIIFYENTYMQNSGVDYTNKEVFEIITILDGTVIEVSDNEILGKTIKIRHNNDLISTYQSLSEVSVKENENVIRGQIIGKSGTCALYNNDSNLHFELYNQGKTVNPEEYYNKTLD